MTTDSSAADTQHAGRQQERDQWYQRELTQERDYVSDLYGRLDDLRAEKVQQLAKVRKAGLQGSVQNHSERDSFATLYEDRLAQLNAVEDRLVFGRLDTDGGDTRYIGRIGLTDEDQHRLLVDWRAPEAAAFYQATAFQRLNVRRRRHLMMAGREVESFDDDVLDAELAGDTPQPQASSALLSAVTARRTGHMGDIVATIQSEQDAIIRDDLSGVLVVQGGPGTGKTAVALHRAAYLLYTYRERLSQTGVLLVGPSDAFMNYIDQVLPSLGENGVVMSSLARLYPGVNGVPEVSRQTAEIKGRPVMVDILRRAVEARQREIPEAREVVVEGTRLKVKPRMIRTAREKARDSGLPHNQAREVFVKHVVKKLTKQMEEHLAKGSDGKNQADRSYVSQEILTSRDVRVLLNLCWMPLTPQKLLTDLFTKPQLLVDAAPELSSREILALLREPTDPMTVADVPLLDEAAELLGEITTGGTGAQKDDSTISPQQAERNLAAAEATLENVHGTLEDLGVDGVVTAEMLAAAQSPTASRRTVAERAQSDRSWTYGHVIVDEAQELSYMQWRLLFRRCPIKSFTIVGDLAQTSTHESDASSWDGRLKPFTAKRNRRLAELTVNYRTPEKITTRAAEVAQAAGRDVTTPKALRTGDFEPELYLIKNPTDLDAALVRAIEDDSERIPGGLIGVVVADADYDSTLQILTEHFGGNSGDNNRVWTGHGLRHTRDIALVTAQQVKGLEYDAVIIVNPQDLVAQADGAVGDLYVAMTRATQSLRMLATTTPDQLPAGLADTIVETPGVSHENW